MENLFTKLKEKGIPERMHGGLVRYIERGVPAGDFLMAVLRNDLRGAFDRADDENAQILRRYVMFLYNDAPAGCWGSPENVKNWIDSGGFYGK